jgi:excisionase family DNA binding protein
VTARTPNLATKPLLSVEDVATLLGQSRSSIYRAIERGDLPLPVFTINGRLRIARRSVERLLNGEPPLPAADQGAVNSSEAGEGTLDGPEPEACASHHGSGWPRSGRPGRA